MALLQPSPTLFRAVKNTAAAPPPDMTVRDVGWMHADLEWTNISNSWEDPCVLQRKTSGSFSAPNLSGAQDPTSNFIWLGIDGINRYTDLGLTEGTTYDYRVAYITNWSSVVRDGDAATYTTWQHGQATTTTRTNTNQYNFVTDFGGVGDSNTNNWNQLKNALAVMQSTGTSAGESINASNYQSAFTSLARSYNVSTPYDSTRGKNVLKVFTPANTASGNNYYGASGTYKFLSEGHATEPTELWVEFYMMIPSGVPIIYDRNKAFGGPRGFGYGPNSHGLGGHGADGTENWSVRQNVGAVSRTTEDKYGGGGSADANTVDYRMSYYVYHADLSGGGLTWAEYNAGQRSYGSQFGWTGSYQRDTWYKINQYIKLNDPGVNNGILTASVDDVEVFSKTDFSWRNSGYSNIKISDWWWDFYAGGDWGAIRDINYYVDDIGISTSGVTSGNDNPSELYIPAGNYKFYPTDSAVQWNGQVGPNNLTVVNGQQFATSMINGDLSNIVIRGDVDGNGDPSTIIRCRAWHDMASYWWLTVLKNSGGNPNNDSDIYQGPSGNDPTKGIRRYGFCHIGDGTENFELRNLDIRMTADPATSSKAWYTLNDIRWGWDTNQKGVYGFNSARNVLVKNCWFENLRGEIIYWGGFEGEKMKIEDCLLKRTNSSVISMSASLEVVDTTIEDCANSGVENAPHALDNNDFLGQPLISPFSGLRFYQDTIIRGCTIKPQKVGGLMDGMSDLDTADNALAGIHVFNQKGTYCTITDTTVEDWRDLAIGPWHECNSCFYDNLTFTNPRTNASGVISMDVSGKTDYKLTGGMDKAYWGNITVDLSTQGLGNGASVYYSIVNKPQDNFIIDKFTLDGGGQTATRLIQERFSSTGRTNYKFRDWTTTSLTTEASNFYVNLNSPSTGLKLPFYEDFTAEWHQLAAQNYLIVLWGQTQLAGTANIIGINNLQSHIVGSTLKFKSASGTQTWIASSSYNTFTQNYTVSGSLVLTCKVIDQNNNKLEFQSLA